MHLSAFSNNFRSEIKSTHSIRATLDLSCHNCVHREFCINNPEALDDLLTFKRKSIKGLQYVKSDL